MKKKIVLIAVCALVLIVAFLLYPAKVEKSYVGAAFSNLEDNSFAPCSLSLSGRLHTRFLPNAEYKGTFSLSVNGQSLFEDASMTARMGADGPSFITCLTDDGYTIPGCFVAPRSFDWLYIRLKPADGTPMEIMAPAETADPHEFPDSPDQQSRRQNRAGKLGKKGSDNKNGVRHMACAESFCQERA